MAITEHPATGTILTCDFDAGFKKPEMVKRRLVVVVSPKIRLRPGLCTVVPLSTTEPIPKTSYHCKITIDPPLPERWGNVERWVKGDMICAVGFHRLDLIRLGKDVNGKRQYRYDTLRDDQLIVVRKCILCSLGLAVLTKHL
jgi:uncharacterized protein YifN (PemK superfamily)